MLFLAMYTFVIVMMRLCGQRNTSSKMKQRNDTNPQTNTGTQRQSRDLLKFIYIDTATSSSTLAGITDRDERKEVEVVWACDEKRGALRRKQCN